MLMLSDFVKSQDMFNDSIFCVHWQCIGFFLMKKYLHMVMKANYGKAGELKVKSQTAGSFKMVASLVILILGATF